MNYGESRKPQGICEGAAWLSSARAVRCRLKCHNERNPCCQLLTGSAEDSDKTAIVRCEEGGDESLVSDKMTIDSKKSSDTCYYLYSSYVCSAKNTDLKFHLEQYGKPVSELKDDDMATQKEDIALGIGKMPLTSAVNPENNKEQFAYSAISLSLNLANGFGLDDEIQKEDGQTFVDPYYLKKLVLKYKDGSEYTVLDENVDNTNYLCGEMENGDTIKIVFNRMVDWSQVETLVVNDVEISVQ